MLNEYGEPKRAHLSWPGKLLAFFLACLIFASAIYLLIQLSSLISPKHRKALKEERAREEAFLRSLDFYVVDSGYVKKTSGLNEIYVPTVQVYIANSSDRIISDFWLMANFEREGKFLCRADRRVVDLKPGESREVGLSCSEAMLVGTVFTGLSLAQTTEDLSYFVWARSNKASVTLLKDVLKFKIVKGRAPY
jgi:hypothetical protein